MNHTHSLSLSFSDTYWLLPSLNNSNADEIFSQTGFLDWIFKLKPIRYRSALSVCSHIAESECESILSGNTEVEFRKSELYSLGNRSGNTEVEFRKSELYSLGNSICRASSTWDRGARKSGDGTEEVTGVELSRKYFRDDVVRKVIFRKTRWGKK